MGGKKIYVVMLGVGEEYDRKEFLYKAFYDKKKAERCVAYLEAEIRGVLSLESEERENLDKKEFPLLSEFEEANSEIYWFRYSKYEASAFLHEVDIADGEKISDEATYRPMSDYIKAANSERKKEIEWELSLFDTEVKQHLDMAAAQINALARKMVKKI